MYYQDWQTNFNRDSRNTLALVLAGGRGTRLQGLTEWRVKPSVPFGGKFRIIDFTLSNCVNSGIRKIGILTQYKSQSLIRHIMQGWSMLHPEFGEFIEVLPAQQRIDDSWYSGTADAIYQNIDLIKRYNPKNVLVLAGDHIYKMDYSNILAFHKNRGADLTVSGIEVPLNEASRFGVMEVDRYRRVIGFEEKPKYPVSIPQNESKALISMGIYVFETDFLFEQLIKDAENPFSSHDFGKDIIPKVIEDHHVYAYPFKDIETDKSYYWRDVGTVDSYWKANMELVGVTPELNIYDSDWPIRTRLRQYPPAKFIFNDEGRRGMAVDSMVSEGSIVSGSYIEESLLFTNVRVEEYSTIRQSVILPNVIIKPNCRISKAVIDKDCVIPEGTIIGEDPVEDRRHFQVSDEGIVLVTPKMIRKQEPEYV